MTAPLTQDAKDAIIALSVSGKSAGQIGKLLGITRHAAIGVLWRHKLKNGYVVANPRKLVLPRKPARPKAVDIQAATPEPVPVPAPDAPPIMPILSLVPAAIPCGIVDVTGCRWPVETDWAVIGGYLFCNAHRENPKPYCDHHTAASIRREKAGA